MARIEIKPELAVGASVSIDGHEFEVVGQRIHTTKDGRKIPMHLWRGNCSTCGNVFEAMTKKGFVCETRRCDEHRTPGRKADHA